LTIALTIALAVALAIACGAAAQLSVRPDDPSGLSIRERRVRVVHSDSPEVPGTSMHLQQWDPWLAYQRGRSYYFREWRPEDRVFSEIGTRPQAAAANSCGICHNLPFPSAGAGGNTVTDVGPGRNVPHLFGGGLLESLSLQIRAELMAAHDRNHNGYIDHPAESTGRAVVEAAPGVEVDFGSLADADGDGRPDLNRVVMLRFVDTEGNRLLFDTKGGYADLTDEDIVGYDFAIGHLASSANDHMFPSLRVFASGVYANIMGILTEDPHLVNDPRLGNVIRAWGVRSNAGAFLTEMFLTGDPVAVADPAARPTITQGELDLFEWFSVNHPRPALGPQDERTRRGRTLMAELGCTGCHVPEWRLKPAADGPGLPGDRRFFDLEVAHNPATGRLEGRLDLLTREVPGPDGAALSVPRRDGFAVTDLYTDLRHHDMGVRFREYRMENGKMVYMPRFKTTPLWGVGSTAPYGHDGLSPTLDDVIRRHGGEAEEAATRYAGAPQADREAVVAFLRSLVLYIPETLPTDLDGDGTIRTAFKVDGREAGPEVFRPELLFRVAPRYRGWTEGPDGDRYFSYELLNVAEAYGETLAGLRDGDGDGLPDIAEPDDPDPAVAGAGQDPAAVGGRR
jgi:hypothetical protein